MVYKTKQAQEMYDEQTKTICERYILLFQSIQEQDLNVMKKFLCEVELISRQDADELSLLTAAAEVDRKIIETTAFVAVLGTKCKE